MTVTATNTKPYVTVLRDLERKRLGLNADLEQLQKDCAELDALIAGIRKIAVPTSVPLQNDLPKLGSDSSQHPAPVKSMSTRWAILNIFGEKDFEPMGVSDVLEALTDIGFPITPKTRGNVSAVLSRMVGFGEVTNAGNSYTITDLGRRSLDRIAVSPIPLEIETECETDSLSEGD